MTKIKIMMLSLLLFPYAPVLAKTAAHVNIDVSLFPVGSFDAESETIEGHLVKSGKTFSATSLKVPVSSLKTGITLRDEHMHARLKSESHPFVEVKDVHAEEKNKKGNARINIAGVEKKLQFEWEKLDDSFLKVQFSLHLPSYKIEDINYRGVGVEDDVQVTAIVPYKSK